MADGVFNVPKIVIVDDDPLPQQTRFVVQGRIDNPSGLGQFDIVVVDDPPLPQTLAPLNPSLLLPGPVNNPPRRKFPHVVFVDDDPLPQTTKFTPQSQPLVPPPFGGHLEIVTVDDEPLPQPQPLKLPVAALAVPVNNPPPTHLGRSPVTASIVAAWQPPDPPPIQRGPLPPAVLAVAVNNPPFAHPGRNPAIYSQAVAAATQPDPWVYNYLGPQGGNQPYGPRHLPPTIEKIDVIPIIGGAWLPTVLAAWIPPDPTPTLPRYLPVAATGVEVDNPPFGGWTNRFVSWTYGPLQVAFVGSDSTVTARGLPPLAVDFPPALAPLDIITIDDPPLPTLSNKLPASLLGVLPSNPPKKRFPHVIFIDDDPLPTLSNRPLATLVQPEVDNPPPRTGRQFYVVYDDPQPQQPAKLPPSILAVEVDNPPFNHQGRSPILPSVLAAWQPLDPLPVQRWPLPLAPLAVLASNAPTVHPAQTIAFGAILTAWQPPDSPPVQQGPLPPAILAVAVNNPPFDARAAALKSEVVALWQPDLTPLPTLLRQIIQPGPFVPPPTPALLPPSGGGKRRLPGGRPIWDVGEEPPAVVPVAEPEAKAPAGERPKPPVVAPPLPPFFQKQPAQPAAPAHINLLLREQGDQLRAIGRISDDESAIAMLLLAEAERDAAAVKALLQMLLQR